MDSYTLLETLCNIPGIPGFEDDVRTAIAGIVKPFVDDLQVDSLGNLLVTRRGKSDFKLMLDAHMDEIGFMVQHVDESGFIRFTPIGGWDARLLPSHMLTVVTRDGKRIEGVIGAQPPHITRPTEREKTIPVEDLFLDVGVTTHAEVAAVNGCATPGQAVRTNALGRCGRG